MTKTVTALSSLFAAAALALAAGQISAETITVSAAASLTNAFKEIAQEYQSRYTGDTVQLNFAGSGALLQQISKGAPVDVFASADDITMDRAAALGLLVEGSRQTFVSNTLVLIQPTGKDTALDALDALQGNRIQRIAVGNPDSVPAGRYTKAALEAANLWVALGGKIIQTQNVRQALDYVARGEVDAGFVYGSDAALMQDKIKVSFVVPMAQPVTYPIALIRGSNESRPEKAAAGRFLDLVVSPWGQKVLARHGFKPAIAG